MFSKYEFKQHVTPRLTPLAAAISGVLVAGQVQATTITVTTLLDGSLAEQCTLRSALQAALNQDPVDACPAGNGDDLIVFASELSGDLQLTQGLLPVNGGVTIDGDDRITVRGDGSDRVFTASAQYAPIKFQNITIADGNASGYGGGILASGRNLTLSNVTLVNNTSTISGGGLHMFNTAFTAGSLTIENSLISGNKAPNRNGGGISLTGYSIPITLRNNVFENNEASTGAGAWLYQVDDYASGMVIENNVFRNNSAYDQGGPLPNDGNGGGLFVGTVDYASVMLQGNYFENNHADKNGGGMWAFISSSFPETTVQLSENVFTGNEAGGQGGGAWMEATLSTVTVSETELLNNQAEIGGGLFINGGYVTYLSELSVQGNQSADGGGGLRINSSGIVDLRKSRFLGNSTSTGCGGGVYFSGSSSFNAIFDSIFRDNFSGECGGAVAFRGWQSSGAQVVIANSEFSNNEEGGGLGGGAILADFTSDSVMMLSNSTLSGNTTQYRGGGLNVEGSTLTLSVGYSTFAYNHAANRGGGIDALVPNCIVGNSLFANNTYGAENEVQEVYIPGCPVRNSLLSDIKYSQFEPDGNVIADQDPLILPLADNGGSNGYTHALQPNSPAIDAGNAGLLFPQFDQRGAPFTRIFGAGLDMGAYEFRQDSIFSDRFENGP